MSATAQSSLRLVLYEGAGAEPISSQERVAALTALLEAGWGVTCSGAESTVPASRGGGLLVLGRFGAGAPAAAVGAAAEEGTWVRFQDLGQTPARDLPGMVEQVRQGMPVPKPGDWKPWFPVIDYDRCTNCMQCLSFCLFGVYGVDEQQRIQVQESDHCKTNCPACSRVCPEAAIMFPKYKSGPINGDQVSAQDLEREKMKVDISALLGGDVYQLLRERSARAQSRFSKERDADKALTERQKCLTKLAQAAEIPAEVLMALPSPEEIQRRAREAMARAEQARQGGA